MEQRTNDPRQSERFPIRIPVYAREDYFGTSVDLSESGMLIRSAAKAAREGASLSVRFTLPGRSEPVVIETRIARIGEQSVDPQSGLGLSFDTRESTHRVVCDYLATLKRDRAPLQLKIAADAGRRMVTLSGVLTDPLQLSALQSMPQPILLNLRDLTILREEDWLSFIYTLPTTKPVALHDCPQSFIQKANRSPQFLAGQEVRSFFAPYRCAKCDRESERLLFVQHLRAKGVQPAALFTCDDCKLPMELDTVADEYLKFLHH